MVSKALSLGARFDMSDMNTTNNFNEKFIKGSTGKPHYARRGHDGVFYEKKAMRKLHIDVDAASEPREKEDIQDITGVVVGVCGPVELARDVIDAVGGVDGDRRSRVGGIEIHEEYVIFFIISSNSYFFCPFQGFWLMFDWYLYTTGSPTIFSCKLSRSYVIIIY